MKLLTLVLALLATSGVAFWLQNNNSPQSDKPITVTRAQVKPEPTKPNRSSKPETSYADRTTASPDLPKAESKPVEMAEAKLEPAKQMPATMETPSTVNELDDRERLTEGAAKIAKPVLPENWAETTQAAISEPDPELRGEAIQTVSLYQSEEAIAVLTEVSTVDPDPFNRAKAVQALWNSAADNLDSNDSIKDLLQKAQGDPDPVVATMATKAVADLDRLAKRRGRGS